MDSSTAHNRFENLDPDVRPDFRSLFKWAVLDRIAGRRRKSPDHADIPVVEKVDFKSTETASVTWLGHASCLISLGGQWLLTDPVFAKKLGGLVPRNVPVVLPPERLPAISTVLLSHNHRDHLDKKSLLSVERLHGPTYIVPLGVETILIDWGIHSSRIKPMGWWESIEHADEFSVTAVPAQHWSRRGLTDLNKSWWCGFVLQTPRQTLYFAGDSGYFDQFEEIGKRFEGIDLALLPIGAYDPQWFMSPQHMNPEEALQAMLDVRADRMLPIHWGTYKLSDEPLDEPANRLSLGVTEQGIDKSRIVIPAVGETFEM